MGHVPDAIEQIVDLGVIMSQVQNPELALEESKIAATAIQRRRAQLVVDVVAEKLIGMRQTLAEKRAGLLGEVSLINTDLGYIDRAFEGEAKAKESGEIRGNDVEIVAGKPVTLDQFKAVLLPLDHSSRTITHNWEEMIKLCKSQADGTSRRASKERCDLPVPEIVEARNGRIDFDKSRVDPIAFVRVSKFIGSFGPHYNDQLRGIKELFGSSSPAGYYRTFILWRDFANNVVDPSDLQTSGAESSSDTNEANDGEITLDDLRNIHDSLWSEAVKAASNEGRLIDFLRNHPPFTIHTTTNGIVTPFNHDFYILQAQLVNSRFAESRYTISKAYTCLARRGLLASNMHCSQYDSEWGIVFEQAHDPKAEPDDSIFIKNPALFFENALAIPNFGSSHVLAVLAVAYIQAEQEFEASSE